LRNDAAIRSKTILPPENVDERIGLYATHKTYMTHIAERPTSATFHPTEGFAFSHVVPIANLRMVMFLQVLHDFANLSGATQSDGVFAVNLRVVPIHLG
jgi:hypothetical protein